MPNHPRMLGRDLAEQKAVYLTRSTITGGPAGNFKFPPPKLPHRNPSRQFHRPQQDVPETFSCSLTQNGVENTWQSEHEAIHMNNAFDFQFQSLHVPRPDHMSVGNHFPMKQEMEQDSRRIFINGLDEDWGSDSSADLEIGLASPSVWTRKQSITTAATSVDFQPYSPDKGTEGYPREPYSSAGRPAGAQLTEEQPMGPCVTKDYVRRGSSKEALVDSSETHAAWLPRNEGTSWVNFEDCGCPPGYDQGVGLASGAHELDPAPHNGPMMFSMEEDRPASISQQTPPRVPDRRPSPSHQVTFILGADEAITQNHPGEEMTQNFYLEEYHNSPKDTTDLSLATTQFPLQETTNKFHHGAAHGPPQGVPRNLSQENASQLLLPSPPASLPQDSSHPQSHADWDDREPAFGPVVPTGCHQPRENSELDLSSVAPDELSLPPLSSTGTTATTARARAFSSVSQHQQPNLLSKPRKSHSVTKLPLRNVHHWLESNGRARAATCVTVSPTGVASPTSSVPRVSGQVLEALRFNVQNFPDTMLRTSSVTIDQIRDYSNKVKRSDTPRQLVPSRETDEHVTNASQSSSSPMSPSLSHKGSFGNLKFVSSLRGKFARFNTSPSASSIDEQVEYNWPMADDAPPAASPCDSPLIHPSSARDAACMNAFRKVLPGGTTYLLDSLRAHFIAYNYIDSLCGSLPQLPQSRAGPNLRTRPSVNVTLPPGVTSLADLRVQEDVSETIVQDFQDDIATVAARNVVPSKAASLLGLGSTNMGKPVWPSPTGGHENETRKIAFPGGFRGHYLESDSAMRALREDIAHNIQRLVETVKTCSSAEAVDTEEAQDGNIVPHGKQLDGILMRALSEIVRCYEELSC